MKTKETLKLEEGLKSLGSNSKFVLECEDRWAVIAKSINANYFEVIISSPLKLLYDLGGYKIEDAQKACGDIVQFLKQ